MDAKHEYKEHYVAFLDILGFKNMLDEKASCDEIYSVFEELKKNSHTSLFYNGKDVTSFDDVKYYIMSDSIVLYIPTDIEDAFLALVGTCLKLQMNLLFREKPILIRGGIAKGNLFVEGNIIFGQGLSNAYKIENDISIYPRIVFNKDLLQEAKLSNETGNKKHWEKMMIRRDDDELCFVYYLSFAWIGDLNNIPLYWDRVLTYCQKYLDSSYNKSIRDKYLWLKKYLVRELELQKDFVKSLPNGADTITRWVYYNQPRMGVGVICNNE